MSSRWPHTLSSAAARAALRWAGVPSRIRVPTRITGTTPRVWQV